MVEEDICWLSIIHLILPLEASQSTIDRLLYIKEGKESIYIVFLFCRYIEIIKREGLEISQPALDPNSTDIHHRITIRARNKKFHR